MKPKKNINKLQEFIDSSYTDEELQKLMNEFRKKEEATGIRDHVTLGEIYDYLDKKFKANHIK